LTLTALYEVGRELLNAPRKAWVQPAICGEAADCLIFLDGELYIDRVKAPEIVHDLQTTGRLPPVASIYLSCLDTAARHTDFTCNENYSLFVATGFCRWIEQTVGSYKRTFLCGLSLSGLSAAFTVLRHPNIFSGALCQSPSAWWNDQWLVSSLTRDGSQPGRFWISVGDEELQENVAHPPSGLFQKTCQLDSVRGLARALSGSGRQVRYNEFAGGHDPARWADELPQALAWLIQCV
jgi:enterochelin esterase family protein